MKKNQYSLIPRVKEFWELKIFRIMRATLMIILMTVYQVIAIEGYSQNTRLSLNLKNAAIRDVLLKIEDKSDFYFMYDATKVDVTKVVNIECANMELKEILDRVFQQTGITYEINNRQIALNNEHSVSRIDQSSKRVSGIVTDPSGSPLPGVTVIVKGTTQGTVTGADGNYSLAGIPENAVLQFSFVGMRTQEMPVTGRSIINVEMQEETVGIEEVVAVGYGTMKKSDLTGAVASVSGEKLAAIPVSNVAQALQGRLPGVNVVSQDGRPDAEVSIRVRGGGSISQSNDPLVLVDGFSAGSIKEIPANQIASIDVLKDAAATAIYGARGANGVIIITTKRGSEGKLTVSYDGYGQFNAPVKYLPTMDAYNYIAYNWAHAAASGDSYANAWEMLWGIGRYASEYNPEGIDYYKNVTTSDLSREVYNSSFTHNHSINISSGSHKTKYLFSVNYLDNDGMKLNSWYKRVNVSFNLDQKLTDNLTFSIDTRFTDIKNTGDEYAANGKGSLLSSAYRFRPIATEDVKGILDESVNTQIADYKDILQDLYNPVERIKDYTPSSDQRSLTANTALSWQIIKGFTARSELGLRTYWNRSKSWTGAIYNEFVDAEGNKTFAGNAEISSGEGWNMHWANTLHYIIPGLGNNHNLDILAGQEISDSGSESITIRAQRFPANFDMKRAFALMQNYNTDKLDYHSLSSSTGTPNRMESYFGRINYSLMDRYLLSATFRADGSSRFAPTNRWGYFPAAALGWRMSEENFLKGIDWIDNLKLRVSYGSVGNDGISANLWKTEWTSISSPKAYSINEIRQAPVYVPASSTIANPYLKWETTITRNLGLDYSFFNNRLYGTFDVYKNNTKDLLTKTPVQAYTGFSYSYDNIGSTSNRGWEFSVGGRIVQSDHFNLNASININVNRGKIDELAEGVTGLYQSGWVYGHRPNDDYVLEVGRPVGMVRGYIYDGWYTVDDFDYDPTSQIYTLKEGIPDITSQILSTVLGTTGNKPSGQTAYPGVIKLKNINNEGNSKDVVDTDDISVIGNMNPKHTGGFNINGDYKNFDFALDFNWSYGNQIYNANYMAAFIGKSDRLYQNRLDYLSSSYKIYDIQNGNLVKITDPDALNELNKNATTFMPFQENSIISTMGIQDGSYLRLNTVTLGYTLPKNLLGRIGSPKIRVYGSIYNALTFTKYDGLDPEVNTNTNLNNAEYPTIGLDWGAYPRARSFTFGLNVEF